MSGTWDYIIFIDSGYVFVLRVTVEYPNPHYPPPPRDPAPKFSLYQSTKYIALSCGEPILCGRGPLPPMCDPPPKVSLYQ